jgi:hypothetical protein
VRAERANSSPVAVAGANGAGGDAIEQNGGHFDRRFDTNGFNSATAVTAGVSRFPLPFFAFAISSSRSGLTRGR